MFGTFNIVIWYRVSEFLPEKQVVVRRLNNIEYDITSRKQLTELQMLQALNDFLSKEEPDESSRI